MELGHNSTFPEALQSGCQVRGQVMGWREDFPRITEKQKNSQVLLDANLSLSGVDGDDFSPASSH